MDDVSSAIKFSPYAHFFFFFFFLLKVSIIIYTTYLVLRLLFSISFFVSCACDYNLHNIVSKGRSECIDTDAKKNF